MDHQPNLPRLSRKQMRRFRPLRVNPVSRSFNAYLLANIYDLIMKWGTEEERLFLENGTMRCHPVRVYYLGGRQLIRLAFVARDHSQMSVTRHGVKDPDFIRIHCRPDLSVLWERGLEPMTVEEQIQDLHRRLEPLRIFSPKNGQRLTFGERLSKIREQRRQGFASRIRGFTPHHLPQEVSDITPWHLADIYDLLDKYGQEDVDDHTISYSIFDPRNGEPVQIGVCGDLDEDDIDQGILVDFHYCQKCRDLYVRSYVDDDSELIEIPVRSKYINSVMWDELLLAEDVDDMIAAVDLQSICTKRADPETCQRKEFRTIAYLTSLYVDELFPYRERIVLPQEIECEQPVDVTEKADIPEEIRYVEHEAFGFVIVHRDSRLNDNMVTKIVLNALEKLEIHNPMDLDEAMEEPSSRQDVLQTIEQEVLELD